MRIGSMRDQFGWWAGFALFMMLAAIVVLWVM
jgi:hypothetical protein